MALPNQRFGRYAHRLEAETRIGRAKVQMRWNDTVPQTEDDLDQASNTSGGFQVTDIGFHRAHHAGALGWAPLSKQVRQNVELNGVAQRRARAMRLDVIQIRRG